MIWALLCIFILGAIVWLIAGMKRIGQVSPGAKIPARSGTALLLIDLQTVFWQSGAYNEATKTKVLETINVRVAEAKIKGYPIIAIRQEWSEPATRTIATLFMKGQAIAGSEGTEIATPFADTFSHQITKRVQDSFETGELDELLSSLQIGTLDIIGLDGEHCIARTTEAALNRGYVVNLIQCGIAIANIDKTSAIFQQLGNKGARLL